MARFRPSVRSSVTLFCAQLLLQFFGDMNQTFTEWLSPSGAAHIVSILRFHYLSRNYCLFLNLHCPSVRPSHSSVRNSYSSYANCTKLSQNDCHQVPQRILLVFCDCIIYQGHIAFFKLTLSVCPSVTLFCAQLLLQFLCELYQTFTEWL